MLHEQDDNINLYQKELKKLQNKSIRVGSYIVHFEKNIIVAPDSSETQCSEKLLSLLGLFIIKQGKVVTRDDAFDIVYKGQHVVESSFRHRVKDLRQIFNDDPPYRYIENIKGKGYFLKVGTTEYVEIAPPQKTEVKSSNRLFATALSLAFVFILLSVLLIKFLTPVQVVKDSKIASVSNLVPVTFSKGHEYDVAASPNGRYLLYSYRKQNSENWQIRLLDLETRNDVALTGLENIDFFPKWSRNSQYITFHRRSKNTCQYIKAKLDLESKTLTEFENLPGCKYGGAQGYSLLWNNNRSLIYSNSNSFSSPMRIYARKLSGATEWPITSPPPDGRGDYLFVLSPDEQELVVLRNRNWSHTEIWLYNTKTWEGKKIDETDYILFNISWNADGSKLLYRSNQNSIVEFEVETQKKHVVRHLSVPFRAPLLVGKDFSQILVRVGAILTTDIMRMPLDGTGNELVVSSSFNDIKPRVSFDNKLLAWVSDRSGLYQLWLKPLDGDRSPLQVTQLTKAQKFESIAFSPNHKRLSGTLGGKWFIADINADKVTVQYYKLKEGWAHLLVWKDEKTLIFIKTLDGTRYAVEFNIEEGVEKRLNIDDVNLILPGVKKDQFFFIKKEINGIWEFSNGNERLLVELEGAILNTHNWNVTSDGIYFRTEKNKDGELQFYEFQTKDVKTLKTPNFLSFEHNELSNSIYFVSEEDGNPDLYLLND
ncbi:winged helix-turn-helix domain-containing protein [Pleionea sp. CnH1-48]|uniref:winged helix-turn-helix domain-containing protein n=1 Tax=Pleionea sp. CnH1-48 TaxID=2954494 RepID=UPI002098035F|nr:winged helix-turn-helix domain-containing protein [Pleionea sp. CnH1-48]MCO7222780.1 winged helix-turn-helix domain-containing protein [Pleionea sp. CnH1-48]